MGTVIWLLLFSLGGVSGIQRWLQLPNHKCQGCKQFSDDSATFMSLVFDSTSNLILGGRNRLHSIDMLTDTHQASDDDSKTLEKNVEMCLNDGRSQEDCQNYYKVLLMLSETDIMTCGTWGYDPKCDVRSVSNLSFKDRAFVRPGKGFCPADPSVTTSYIQLGGDIGFASNGRAITRFNLQPGSLSSTSQTFKTDDMLKNPQFVYSFEEGDHVYFLFRETAIEVATEKIYSRVARICRNDVGSSSSFFDGYFLSYFKARLFCTSSRVGEPPFDHDEVDGAIYRDGVLYASFSGPKNLQTGSIVCSYTIGQINEAFDEGPYLVYNDEERAWFEMENREYSCSTKKEAGDAIKLFLMANRIHNRTPLYTTSSTERLTSMTADSFTYDNEQITILYAGSDHGRVYRVAFVKELESSVHSTFYSVGAGSVRSVTYGDGHIYAMGGNWLTRIPIRPECSATNCGDCLAAHFPYCGWCHDVSAGLWSCSVKKECTRGSWLTPTDICRSLPTFITVPKNLTLREGNTAQFECTSHEGRVVWTKDGGPLPQKAGFIDVGNVYIPDVGLEDTGFYECSVNNTSGVVVKKAHLTVQVPARFLIEPTNVSVTFGHQDLVLTCRAQGLPKPEIWWLRTNGDLPDGSQVLPNGDLKIFRVMKGDEGGYRCYVRNDLSETIGSRTAFVTVDEKDDGYDAMGTDDQNTLSSPISLTILIVGICLAAVFCFIIGLTARVYYRRKRQKRDYMDGVSPHGTFSQFPGYPAATAADDGYLCPSQSWAAWQSFHRHHTGLSGYSPDTAMTNLMSEEEAPPAYSPNFTEWYPGTGGTASTSNRDYAEIMTFGTGPPPPVAPPPVAVPPVCRRDIAGHFAPSPTLHTVAHAAPQPITPPAFLTAPAGPASGFSPGAPPPAGTIHDYSTKLQVSSAI